MVEQQTPKPSNINLRSKGLTNSLGKLHKGCVKDATSKLSIGSIPATYQSIIYRSQSKKAFGTSAKRFFRNDEAERILNSDKNNLGGDVNRLKACQKYQENQQLAATQDNSYFYGLVQENRQGIRKDFNKEGHGAFISKVKRQWVKGPKAPGPTHYHKSEKISKDSGEDKRKCKTRVIRNRKNMIATAQNKSRQGKTNQNQEPGPGYYLSDKKQLWRTTTKGWRSSFQTKVSRDGYIPNSISPGPGFYKDGKQKKVSQEKDKKSKKEENSRSGSKDNGGVMADLINQNNYDEPGPGWYNHQIPNFKPLYEKIKMSNYFMSPVFMGKRKPKPSPGPTFYDVKRIYEDLKPKLIQSTAFMSETKRIAFQPSNIYGPNLVAPEIMGPKNFHFNINDEWL